MCEVEMKPRSSLLLFPTVLLTFYNKLIAVVLLHKYILAVQ